MDLIKNKPLLFAHRGASGYEYENSLPAFEKALELGSDGLETDIWELADGEIVLFHDSIIKKNNNEILNISNLTSSEINKFTLPNNTKIPTLKEFFKIFANRKSKSGEMVQFSFDLQDLKVGSSIIPYLSEFNVLDRTYLCGNNFLLLKKVRKINSHVKLIASNLQHAIIPENFTMNGKISTLDINGFNIKAENLLSNVIPILKQNKMNLFIWDLHTIEKISFYLQYNPKGFFTNYPDIALHIRDQMWS